MTFLWSALLLYVLARLCQLYADRLPTQLIVILHVIPPAVFPLVHGSILYRIKGISIFAAFCLGFGALAEVISLHTGFPFGDYYFTAAMGPKVLHVPVLLVLAYLGIGYVSWVLALLILGYLDQPMTGVRIFALPLLASFIMLAWDLSMDPDWSTLDHVWIWQHGGAYFGVPLSNFFGWFFTAYVYYLAFALYCRAQPFFAAPPPAKPLVHGDSTICDLRLGRPPDSGTTDGASSSHRCHWEAVAYSRYSRWLHSHVTSAHGAPRLAGMAKIERIAGGPRYALSRKKGFSALITGNPEP